MNTSKDDDVRLDACPFCGGDAQFREGHMDHWTVVCPRCRATVDRTHSREGAKEQCAADWNTRASPPAVSDVGQIVEQLQEALAACERVRDESKHADFEGEDYRRGFNAGASGCIVAIRGCIERLSSSVLCEGEVDG